MLIIEIHVDNHENNAISTRASQVREDAHTRPQNRSGNLVRRFAENIKAWIEERDTNSSHTHGL